MPWAKNEFVVAIVRSCSPVRYRARPGTKAPSSHRTTGRSFIATAASGRPVEGRTADTPRGVTPRLRTHASRCFCSPGRECLAVTWSFDPMSDGAATAVRVYGGKSPCVASNSNPLPQGIQNSNPRADSDFSAQELADGKHGCFVQGSLSFSE